MTEWKLGLRLATASVLVPLFVATIVVGGLLFLAAVLFLTTVMTVEFFRLAGEKSYAGRFLPGVGLAMAFPLLFYWTPDDLTALIPLFVLALVGIPVAQMLDPSGQEATASVAFTVFGAAYVGILTGHQVLLREMSRESLELSYESGALLLVLVFLLIWINDAGAYFAGKRWGRRRLLPRISPGKSVAGAAGGTLATVAAALVLLPLADSLGIGPRFGIGDALMVGLLVAIAAPLGDLVESMFKRDAGVKDVSQAVPGHGGVLDRFDSALVVVPVFYYYVRAALL